ncbi:MAG: hypothetical protein Q7R42_06050 [Candidatus Planktophila sp.]|nr:hypothetical protein [Candidatus Planktophila sp.]
MSQRKERLTIETLESEKTPSKVLNDRTLSPETGFSPTLSELSYRVSLTIEGKLNQLIAMLAVAK